MACNCATTEQINELYRQFGEKQEKLKKFSFKALMRKIAVILCIIPLLPFMILYVYYKAFCSDDNKISIVKFFNLKPKNSLTNVG